MKVFLGPSHKVLSPFGDPAREGRILDAPLCRVMDETYAVQKLSVVRGWPPPGEAPPFLVAADNLYISAALLKKFLQAARTLQGLYQLALRPCLFTQEFSDLQETVVLTDAEETWRGYQLYWVN